MGAVIQLHTRYLNKLASIYVDYYFSKEGPPKAKQWALRTLGPKEIEAIRPIIHKKFADRGYDSTD